MFEQKYNLLATIDLSKELCTLSKYTIVGGTVFGHLYSRTNKLFLIQLIKLGLKWINHNLKCIFSFRVLDLIFVLSGWCGENWYLEVIIYTPLAIFEAKYR